MNFVAETLSMRGKKRLSVPEWDISYPEYKAIHDEYLHLDDQNDPFHHVKSVSKLCLQLLMVQTF